MKGFVAAALSGFLLSAAWGLVPASADEVALDLGSAVTTEDLGGTRAKGAADITQDATVENNGSISGTTGDNSILNSFTGAQGLFNVSQNSGNNVSIQQAIGINVTLCCSQ